MRKDVYAKTKGFRIRDNIKHLETQEVLRIDDEKGREYIYDGSELYRLIPLKGRFGRLSTVKS